MCAHLSALACVCPCLCVTMPTLMCMCVALYIWVCAYLCVCVCVFQLRPPTVIGQFHTLFFGSVRMFFLGVLGFAVYGNEALHFSCDPDRRELNLYCYNQFRPITPQVGLNSTKGTIKLNRDVLVELFQPATICLKKLLLVTNKNDAVCQNAVHYCITCATDITQAKLC